MYYDPALVLYEDNSMAKTMGGCFIGGLSMQGASVVVTGTTPDRWDAPQPVSLTLKFPSELAVTQFKRKTQPLLKL